MKMAFTIFDDNANGKPMAPATNTGSSHTLDTNTCCKPSSTFFESTSSNPNQAAQAPATHQTRQIPSLSTKHTAKHQPSAQRRRARAPFVTSLRRHYPVQVIRVRANAHLSHIGSLYSSDNHQHNDTHRYRQPPQPNTYPPHFPKKNSLDFSEYSLYGHAKRI